MKNKLVFFIFLFLGVDGFTQTDSSQSFSFSAYAEAYYSATLHKNDAAEKPLFFYNYKQNNQYKINIAFAKLAYIKNKLRANVALMAGDYATYNLANEKGIAQHILEANIGIKLWAKNNVWIDIGVMPSHIGFESAIGADCFNLSRSLVAENSPYFETGIKLSGTSTNKKLNWSLLWLNGWQKIGVPNDYTALNFGMQVNYVVSDKLTLNYSNFFGSDKPKPNNYFRSYHNLYAQIAATAKTNIIVGCDVGTDKNELGKSGIWLSPVLVAKYKWNTKFSIASRVEYVSDKNNVYYSHTNEKFSVWGVSANIDYAIAKWVLLRTEIRRLAARNGIVVLGQAANQHWINGVLVMRW